MNNKITKPTYEEEIKKEFYNMVGQEWGNLLHDRLDGNVSGQMSKSQIIIASIWSFISEALSSQRDYYIKEVPKLVTYTEWHDGKEYNFILLDNLLSLLTKK